ncbi:hypothetical protein VMCG_09026 [Cytospora schulzeri]|uniref:Protein kinase domain-containing protein n=1 Tax=Cytospora schulzeri TaxID=448051 RepID=A0A423VPN7_9PEZI|nr:hypothetical protein VMCG_09026 [Valsa malicola]
MHDTAIARVVDTKLPEPEFDSDAEDDLEIDISDFCEAVGDYKLGDLGALFPICIGDIIHVGHDQYYRIDHRLGRGAFSTVWVAYGSKQDMSVALKILRAGGTSNAGEKEYTSQRMLGEANIDKSHLNLYQDTFYLQSPYGKHRVLVLPLAGPSLSKERLEITRTLKARMSAAKDLLEALRSLHQAGLLSDINLGNILWKVHPEFVQAITDDTSQVLGAPTQRLRLSSTEKEFKSGHRVLPASFPPESLSDRVYLDMWSFMVVFIYLYLGKIAFPEVSGGGSDPMLPLARIIETLGPLPEEWSKPKPKFAASSYESSKIPTAPKCIIKTWLREDWERDVPRISKQYKELAKYGDERYAKIAKRTAQEAKVKEQAESHALKVICSVFRHRPETRLTAAQLLENPDWKKFMELCGV